METAFINGNCRISGGYFSDSQTIINFKALQNLTTAQSRDETNYKTNTAIWLWNLIAIYFPK